MNAWRNAYDTDAIYEYGSPRNCLLLRYNVLGVAKCPTYVFKKVVPTLRWYDKERGPKQNPCVMHMRKAQHGNVHSLTI